GQAAVRALREAHEALAQAGTDTPESAYWVNETELCIMDARVYTELRRPLSAVPLLTEVLREYPQTAGRERALYASWLAAAYADANEPEQAARVTAEVLELSGGVNSRRVWSRARLLLSLLDRFPHVPEVRRLQADATAA